MPIFDKTKSKIKLWLVLGENNIETYYSILSQDMKQTEIIISKMSKRILENKYKGIYLLARFYDNLNGVLIKTTQGNNKIQNAEVKLWVGFSSDRKNETWYSKASYNSKSISETIEVMSKELLSEHYRYDFTKAMFFNNQTGILLKTVSGNI